MNCLPPQGRGEADNHTKNEQIMNICSKINKTCFFLPLEGRGEADNHMLIKKEMENHLCIHFYICIIYYLLYFNCFLYLFKKQLNMCCFLNDFIFYMFIFVLYMFFHFLCFLYIVLNYYYP